MAHHGLSDLEKLAQQYGMDEFKKSMPAPQAERIEDLLNEMKAEKEVGATGNFPDGKISENDDGEISIGITSIENRVVMNFGKPVKWIGFTREQAKQIAESLIKNSK